MATPQGPYSPSVQGNGFLFCSGQIGLDGDNLVEGFEPQLRQALLNVRLLVEQSGASMSDVIKTTVFLTDVEQFAVMNEIYAEVFGEARPARSTVVVAALPKGAVVEVEATALLV